MQPGIRSRQANGLYLAGGIAAPLVAVAAFLWAASRHPGFDHVSDTISKLSAQGVTDRWPWTAGLLLYALLVVVFAVGLRYRFPGRRWGAVLSWAMGAHGVLMMVVALVRDDLEAGGFFSLEGAVHDVVSGMAFSSLILAMLALALIAERPFVRVWTLIAGGFLTAVAIGFLFTPPSVQGVPQRFFAGLGALWMESIGIWLVVPPLFRRD